MPLLKLFIVLTIQVLIVNQIHLFGYITPLFIGYVVISSRKGFFHILLLLLGFFTGLLFDMFSNTAGMAAASMTLIAMAQPSLLRLFAPRDSDDNYRPTIMTLGTFRYWIYSLLCMAVLHVMFYTLDAFSLNDWPLTLLSIIGSSLFASILCVIAELIVRKRRR